MSSIWHTGRFANVEGEDQIATRTDVTAIIDQMVADLQLHPDEWENRTLESFLEGLARSLRDLNGLYANRGEKLPAQPSWKMLAEVLIMASGYE